MLVGLDLHVVVEVNAGLGGDFVELEHPFPFDLGEVEGLGESEVDVLRLLVGLFVGGVDVLSVGQRAQVVEVFVLGQLEHPGRGQRTLLDYEFQVSVEGVSDFVLVAIAEIGVHLVVLQPCHFHQEAERVAVDHLVALEQGLRVREGNDFVVLAVGDDEEAVYLGDVVHQVEAVVLEGRVSG